jgi:hypothetical protein
MSRDAELERSRGPAVALRALVLRYAHGRVYIHSMKQRKDLLLSREAIARGEQLAQESRRSLSAVVEAQLLGAPCPGPQPEEHWPGPALKPLARPGDARARYISRKHGA